MIKEGFAEAVKASREALDMTQEALGRAIGLDQSWVSTLERKRLTSLPDPLIIEQLAHVLGLTVPYLLRAAGYNLIDDDIRSSWLAHLDLSEYLRVRGVHSAEQLSETLEDIINGQLRREALARANDPYVHAALRPGNG